MHGVVHLGRLALERFDDQVRHPAGCLLLLHLPHGHQRLAQVEDVVGHLQLGDCRQPPRIGSDQASAACKGQGLTAGGEHQLEERHEEARLGAQNVVSLQTNAAWSVQQPQVLLPVAEKTHLAALRLERAVLGRVCAAQHVSHGWREDERRRC